MKKTVIAVFLALCLFAGGNSAYAKMADGKMVSHMQQNMQQMCFNSSKINFNKAMRSLWEVHVIYTRNYIISALGDLPDKDAVAQRLLKNQDDIGNAIKPYYGDDAGSKLTKLLKDHIMIATEVVTAAKTNDSNALANSQNKWKANAADIAAFLSSANPNWSKNDLTNMLYTHLDLTTGEVVGRLSKDWKKDIESFDAGEIHMLKFADMLSNGIIKQFPDKFTK